MTRPCLICGAAHLTRDHGEAVRATYEDALVDLDREIGILLLGYAGAFVLALLLAAIGG